MSHATILIAFALCRVVKRSFPTVQKIFTLCKPPVQIIRPAEQIRWPTLHIHPQLPGHLRVTRGRRSRVHPRLRLPQLCMCSGGSLLPVPQQEHENTQLPPPLLRMHARMYTVTGSEESTSYWPLLRSWRRRPGTWSRRPSSRARPCLPSC